MESLWTECYCCGDVMVRAQDLVRVPARKWLPRSTRSNYEVTCPMCLSVIVRPADDTVERVLARAELAAAPAQQSADRWTVLQEVAAPALTEDDVHDFVLALANTDALLQELLREN